VEDETNLLAILEGWTLLAANWIRWR